MNNEQRYLIGGARMVELGSDRRTDDTDFLVNRADEPLFIHEEGNVDLINAAAHPFYMAIWNEAQTTGITPELMLEMKSFSLAQHLMNGNWSKVASTEYDMNRLVIDFEVRQTPICAKFLTPSELCEVKKAIKF
jgi:hypothetical protein